jgi:hypothetical protein
LQRFYSSWLNCQGAMGTGDQTAAQCRLLAGPAALGAQLLLAALALASLLYKR